MLRGGVIGFGRMGLTHFSILNNHPEVQFAAICDSSSFILKNIRKHMGLETFTDYRKMIDTMALDFVIVATPTVSHFENVQYALQRKLHVFVEKPLALNSLQGRELVDMAEGTGLVNQVGYVIRFNDVFLQVRKHVKSGLIGALTGFKMEMYGPTVLHDAKASWRSKKTQGGGALYDFGSHPIDLINYVIGQPDRVTGSVLQHIHSADVEDAVLSTFLYDSGACGSLLVNWSDPSYRKPTYRMEVSGREGKIAADLHSYKLFLRKDHEAGGLKKGWNTRYVTDFMEPVRFYVRGAEYTRQLDYFIDCILTRAADNVSSFAEGLKADVVIERIVGDHGARSGRVG